MANRVDNNVMHAKPDLRADMKWMITRSGSVITAVIPLGAKEPRVTPKAADFDHGNIALRGRCRRRMLMVEPTRLGIKA